MMFGHRVGAGYQTSTIGLFVPRGNEPPLAGTGRPGLYPGWQILLTRSGIFHKPNKSAVSGMRVANIVCVQTQNYCMRRVE